MRNRADILKDKLYLTPDDLFLYLLDINKQIEGALSIQAFSEEQGSVRANVVDLQYRPKGNSYANLFLQFRITRYPSVCGTSIVSALYVAHSVEGLDPYKIADDIIKYMASNYKNFNHTQILVISSAENAAMLGYAEYNEVEACCSYINRNTGREVFTFSIPTKARHHYIPPLQDSVKGELYKIAAKLGDHYAYSN